MIDILILIVSTIAISGIIIFLWGNVYMVWFFLFSILILFLIWKAKKILWVVGTTLALLFALANIGIFLFLLIPVVSYKIDIWGFFQEKQNYLEISINDNISEIKKNKLKLIISKNKNNIQYDLLEYKTNSKKIDLEENETIYLMWKHTWSKSFATIYLWDGTIIRILPWTRLNLEKIQKNIYNLLGSKTIINLEFWKIRVNEIKNIKENQLVQINTKDGIFVVWWSAWYINYDNIWKQTTILNYSKNNIIQIESNKWTIIKNTTLSNIALNKPTENFVILDNIHISNYKNELTTYINSHINSHFLQSSFLQQFELAKLHILNFVDKKLEKKQNKHELLIKYINLYNYLMWKQIDISSIKDIFNDNIIFLKGYMRKESF